MRTIQLSNTEYGRAEALAAEIPREAHTTLQRYALRRVQEMKLVTKAFSYQFPFDYYSNSIRSFSRLRDLVVRHLKKKMPHLDSPDFRFISTESGEYNLRLHVQYSPVVVRYLRCLHQKIDQANIPLDISLTPRIDQNYAVIIIGYRVQNTSRIQPARGALLFYYLPEIIKVLETLQRKGVYDVPIREPAVDISI